MIFDRKEYMKNYCRENIKSFKINFNMKNEYDVELFKVVSQLKNKSDYFKKLIIVDFKNKGLID